MARLTVHLPDESHLEAFDFTLPVGTSTVINEAACRVTVDGVAGSGRLENQWPAAHAQDLVEAEN
jgi:hypothetical protein